MKMFYILFVSGLLTLASAKSTGKDIVILKPEFLQRMRSIIDKCQSETNAPPDAMTKMLQGIIENEATLNFVYCYLSQAGFIEKDGHYNIDNMLAVLEENYPREEYKKTFEDCNKSSGKDHLETLRLMAECYKENSPVMFVRNT